MWARWTLNEDNISISGLFKPSPNIVQTSRNFVDTSRWCDPPDAPGPPELVDPLRDEEAGDLGVGQGAVQQEVDEVAAGLYRQHLDKKWRLISLFVWSLKN